MISLFSGALGLDLGLEQAGFEVRVALECNKDALQTISANRPDLPVIKDRIENVSTASILKAAGLKVGEATIVSGGPSCQPFSTAGRRGSVGDPRGVMFREFCRVVREARPRFFIMENVTGVLSAAVKHRPLKKRGPGFPPLESKEQLGSALVEVLKELKSLGYHVAFGVLNAADYGVPQHRERVIFLGSRDGEPLAMPKRTHSAKGKGTRRWRTLRNALVGLKEKTPAVVSLSATKKKYLAKVPEGGNWRDLPPRFQRGAMGGAFDSWGGRVGFYRRLAWKRVSPSLPTTPVGKATMLCHPTALRPLSVREYARIQQFPDNWEFVGPPSVCYRQIGNAIPVGLGRAIGRAVIAATKKTKRVRGKGVICTSKSLLNRLANGHRTRINPPRMRRVKDEHKVRAWTKTMKASTRSRILNYVVSVDEVRTRQKSRKPKPRRSASTRQVISIQRARSKRRIRRTQPVSRNLAA